MREYGMVPAVACMEMFQPCVGLMSISKHIRPPAGRLGPGDKRDNLTGDGVPHSRCTSIGNCTMTMKTSPVVDSALGRAWCSTITCSYVACVPLLEAMFSASSKRNRFHLRRAVKAETLHTNDVGGTGSTLCSTEFRLLGRWIDFAASDNAV